MNCHVSPIRTAGLVVLAAAMTAMSYFAATHATDYRAWVGWFGVAFFGAGIVVAARQLFNKAPMVSIGVDGITATRIGTSPIPWAQVESVSIGKIRSTRFLCIWLKDEPSYLAKLPVARLAMARANRSLGFPAVTVSFQGLRPGLDEAYEMVRTYVAERSGA
jgi:hypothetical protein